MTDIVITRRYSTCDAPLSFNHEQQTLMCSNCLATLRDAARDYKRTMKTAR